MDLEGVVVEATAWAVDGDPGRGQALGMLARELAKQIADPPAMDGKSLPPTAALAKELRATLEDLEGLRDGDDAQDQLVSGLSSPVLHGEGSEPTDIRSARGQGRGGAGKAADAVATVRGGRGARGGA